MKKTTTFKTLNNEKIFWKNLAIEYAEKDQRYELIVKQYHRIVSIILFHGFKIETETKKTIQIYFK